MSSEPVPSSVDPVKVNEQVTEVSKAILAHAPLMPLEGPITDAIRLAGIQNMLIQAVITHLRNVGAQWVRDNRELIIAGALRAFDKLAEQVDYPQLEPIVRQLLEQTLNSLIDLMIA